MAGKYLAPRKNTPGCRLKGGDPIRDKRRKIITIALAVLFFLLALGLLFRKGKILYKVPQEKLVDALMEEIKKL